MPDKKDKELKRKFGAYLKVAILNAKHERARNFMKRQPLEKWLSFFSPGLHRRSLYEADLPELS